jgi:S1-C subfamily serine protease
MPRKSDDVTRWFGPAFLLIAILLLASVVVLWRLWPTRIDTGNDPSARPRVVAQAAPLTSEEELRIDIFRKAKASVVNVASAKLVRNRFTMDLRQVPKGSGTGFIWDEQGRVVTNYHVVRGADRVVVTLDDHTTAQVAQIRYDEAHDLAVLWTDIPEAKRQPIAIGKSADLQVGQGVLAIGNPFGLDHSLSAGIISALSRDLKNDDGTIIRGVIQTTAAINPGNSGGPLLDNGGRLIGVNAAILSPSGAFAGIGFAIPVDTVNRVVPRLIRGDTEPRPGLGIVEAPDQWARQRDIKGALIVDVLPDGPAAEAKLRPTRFDDEGNLTLGDIIVGIDDHPVRTANEMYAILADEYKVGQAVTVHLLRDGEPQDVKMTLAADSR